MGEMTRAAPLRSSAQPLAGPHAASSAAMKISLGSVFIRRFFILSPSPANKQNLGFQQAGERRAHARHAFGGRGFLAQNLEQRQFSTRDEQEVAGYADVMQLLFESYTSIPLTENHIKQLHTLLLKYSDKDERHRGAYKILSNSVAAFSADGKEIGIIFETSSPFETPLQMQELVEWTNQALLDRFLHPLIVVAVFVVRFLAIHPFQDGNGRLSRILTTLLLLKAGYVYVPYSSLESVVEANKDGYYLALRRTQSTLKSDAPEWGHWLLFFLRSMKKQKDNLLKKVERERHFLQALPQLSADILELARENGRITTGEVLLATQANRATIRKRLEELVRSKLLQQHGQGKGTWYSLPH